MLYEQRERDRGTCGIEGHNYVKANRRDKLKTYWRENRREGKRRLILGAVWVVIIMWLTALFYAGYMVFMDDYNTFEAIERLGELNRPF